MLSRRAWFFTLLLQHRVREHPRQVQRRLPACAALVRHLERVSLRGPGPPHVPELLVSVAGTAVPFIGVAACACEVWPVPCVFFLDL